jgi:hypothetical protein
VYLSLAFTGSISLGYPSLQNRHDREPSRRTTRPDQPTLMTEVSEVIADLLGLRSRSPEKMPDG